MVLFSFSLSYVSYSIRPHQQLCPRKRKPNTRNVTKKKLMEQWYKEKMLCSRCSASQGIVVFAILCQISVPSLYHLRLLSYIGLMHLHWIFSRFSFVCVSLDVIIPCLSGDWFLVRKRIIDTCG